MEVSKDLFRSPGTSPGNSSSISAFTPPSPMIVVAGVGMVLGQDVVHSAEGTVTSPIIVEALVPGESIQILFFLIKPFIQVNTVRKSMNVIGMLLINEGGPAEGCGYICVNDLLQEVA